MQCCRNISYHLQRCQKTNLSNTLILLQITGAPTFQVFFHLLFCSFQRSRDQSKDLINPASSKVGEEQELLPVDLLRWLITAQHSVQEKKLLYICIMFNAYHINTQQKITVFMPFFFLLFFTFSIRCGFNVFSVIHKIRCKICSDCNASAQAIHSLL